MVKWLFSARIVAEPPHGISFLGWRIFPFRRRLKRRNIIAFMRRYRRNHRAYSAGTLTLGDWQQQLMGWIGHVQHGTTQALRRSLFAQPITPVMPPA